MDLRDKGIRDKETEGTVGNVTICLIEIYRHKEIKEE